MIELKRMQSSTDHQNLTSVAPKRQKADTGTSISSKQQHRYLQCRLGEKRRNIPRNISKLFTITQETKEKVGERIGALQQLVSPFGKTDTASVLLEAVEYIRFLHEQVKVLSAPYLHCGPVTNMEEQEEYSLRRRGLCLMPVSSTAILAQSNGADIWAPIKSASPGF